jgi:hypothetical protein
MDMLLTERTRLIHNMNAVAAGTSQQTGAAVDMSQGGGFRGCRFIADFGALTAGQVTDLKVQGSNDNSTWTDLASTKAGPMLDADSNKLLISDVWKPTYRYLRPVVDRGTSNAVINCVLAELYAPISDPTTQDATVSAFKQNISPPSGTA